MEPKDVAAVVLASLSLLVSVVTACLGFVYWRYQCNQHAREEAAKVEQHVADVKDQYRLNDLNSSVREVGTVVKHNAGAPHQLWDLLFNQQAAVNTVGGTISGRELQQHMSRVDSFWDFVIDQHSRGKLPGFFHKDGGWLARADNYRCLFEPLFIANYCQFEPTPYLAAAADGTFLKRPKRYWYIEQQWAQLQPDKPQGDSTAWAKAYKQQVDNNQPHTMQGTPPVNKML
jgi:hypothetical protein